jgi:hypothetical protein
MEKKLCPKTVFNYDHDKLEKKTQINENKKNLKPATQHLKYNYALPPINYIFNKNTIQNNKNHPYYFLNPQKKNSEKNTMDNINKIISIEKIENKSRKSNTAARKNKIDMEKESTKKKPKMAVSPNKINIDNNFKISKVQNKKENNDNINLYINSINELRLPKGFKDISFDKPKNE